MSDTATEVKDTKTVTSPEKEKEVEKKTPTEEKVGKETNGENKAETTDASKKNGVEKESEKEVKPLENGDAKEEVVSQKRKSDVGGGDATDSGSPTEGISPEKKAKLEEKVENGEAEATA
ncbi:uncharacterized protein [Rhodnius prolixus]|uniref:Putative accessory gland protein n=2 Tax=Rhodnius TaxID=13248 RepID=R4FLX0_RHOPR